MTRILLIDNYDSFTYNLLHYFEQLGATVEVIRNDAMRAKQIIDTGYDGIVISPGPATPDDAGVCLDVVANAPDDLPIFGVCLGHQAIGQIFGGRIVRAAAPMHGKTSAIYHDGTSVFKGLPSPFTATRYHSLIVEAASLPDCLHATAHTDDGVIMGLAHRSRPVHGVQFHPESIASEYGHELLKNFLALC